MPSKPVTIGGLYFESQKAAKDFARGVLKDGKIGEPIRNLEHVEFLRCLFFSRPEKIAELQGREIIYFKRIAPSISGESPCFAAQLADGEHLHFSFVESVKALTDQRSQMKAA